MMHALDKMSIIITRYKALLEKGANKKFNFFSRNLKISNITVIRKIHRYPKIKTKIKKIKFKIFFIVISLNF